MSKNIIICSDGTGNTAVKNRGTNVFKLFEAVDLNGHRVDFNLDPQVTLYDDGVGVEGLLPIKVIGGAFGYGLRRNVLKLYTGLVRIYDPGDRIYLFGFSRGAFTVRTLAGLIARCGIPQWEDLGSTHAMRAAVKAAYSAYRSGYRTWLWRALRGKSVDEVNERGKETVAAFKARFKTHDPSICFLGVWDTVDAVGGPFRMADLINTFLHQFKFPDRCLSAKVEFAAHALSIDDERAAFAPVLWQDDPRIEQVWFAGVHSNVGGGYPKQGMSLVALDWMLQKAHDRGLRILDEDRRYVAGHFSSDDKIYDPRGGLGVFYRWRPRDIVALCRNQSISQPKVHSSVFERVAHGIDGYAPYAISPDMDIVFTPTHIASQDEAASARADAMQASLQKSFRDIDRTNLDRLTRFTFFLGQASYFVFIASLFGLAISAIQLELAWFFTSIAVLGISLALALYAEHARADVLSQFWHEPRHQLRKALKSARAEAVGDPHPSEAQANIAAANS